MESCFYKSTGRSLIIGSILAITTMILHPAGGSIEYIIEMSKPFQLTHSIAISCLPFIVFGFYGLTYKLLDEWRFSVLAFIVIVFGLNAAMLAALFNGIILPDFLNQYSESMEQDIMVLKPIMNYGFAINKALDYVFIVSLCVGIAIYAFVIIRLQKAPKRIGYYGIMIFVFAIIGWITNFAFTSLLGFRMIVFSIVGWMLCSGIFLIQSQN